MTKEAQERFSVSREEIWTKVSGILAQV
jgi:hypothetical protein